MLEYVLEVNDLTAAPDDYRAQVVNVASHTQEDIVDRIMKIGAGLTRSDIVSVLEAEKQVVVEIVSDGGAVTTELFNAFPSIQGVFHSAEDSVDGAHQKVKINLHAGTAIRDAAGAVKTKKLPGVVSGTVVSSVTDVKTGSQNKLLTPGRNIKIVGAKLKIAHTFGNTSQIFKRDIAVWNGIVSLKRYRNFCSACRGFPRHINKQQIAGRYFNRLLNNYKETIL
jgi:hypothetical protein